jgi:glycerol-3-phosphate dehydrogenase
MGGTKGSHIVLEHPELLAATAGRELFFEHSDGRIVLIYPLKGRVLVGTTDLEHDMHDPIVCTEEEVDYFFALVRHVFPGIPVDRSQIVYRFAGVRPLPGHGDLAPGFVSRDYRIESERLAGAGPEAPEVLSLVGGKWTTFRASAERLTDRVLDALAQPRRRTTKGVPIGGGRGYPVTERARQRWLDSYAGTVGRERAALLLDRYGTVAEDVIVAVEADSADAPLTAVPHYSTGELRHLARTESVVHLADLLLRRTSLAFIGDASREAAAEIAEVVGDILGWDAAARAAEVDHALTQVQAAEASSAARSAEAESARPAPQSAR